MSEEKIAFYDTLVENENALQLLKLRPNARGYLEALLQPSADGLFALANSKQLNVEMVAGTGFEPVTFRL